ncbi:Torsin-1A-interacting protein 1 [Frankliniella fusca]|uniref:Torsin-1A-interacting protein 1 n=1 Tax=Frankliniella fusca TaxID=407009 RepID=A0AAE1L9J1_9NEOP|nr:Torsin-1A-interacting protein 1 [Frankliniella fusca]
MTSRSSIDSYRNKARQRHNSLYKNEDTNTSTDEDSEIKEGPQAQPVKQPVKQNTNSIKEGPQAQPVKQPVKQNTNSKITWVQVVLIIGLVLCGSVFLLITWKTPNKLEDNITETVLDLRKRFPNQSSDLWNHILYVLNNANNDQNKCPSVLLLLSRGDKLSEDSINCLIEKIANGSASILGGGRLKLSGEDFSCDDCTDSTRQKLLGTNGIPVVVIKQLEKFPIKAVKALHYFCDEYETDFAKAAYLLSLTADGNGDEKPVKSAEKKLRALWSAEEKSDYLNPLITRLTSLVEFVKPEEQLPC